MGDRRRAGLWAWVALVVALWSLPPAGASPGWSGRGHVVAVDPAQGTVVLDHDTIPGLLPAARGQFPVARAELLRSILPGDAVRFTLVAADDAHGLLRLTSLAPDVPTGTPWRVTLLGAAVVLALGALGTVLALCVILWRHVQALERGMTALDHEAGMLRRLGGETQDALRQMAHALEEIAVTVLVGYVRELQRRLPPAAPFRPDAPTPRGGGDPVPALVVVQRGRTGLFQAVESGAVGPGVRVTWDRRRGERRASRRGVALERRRAERRAPPPETWVRLGFVLAPLAADEPARSPETRGPRPLRAVGSERGPTR